MSTKQRVRGFVAIRGFAAFAGVAAAAVLAGAAFFAGAAPEAFGQPVSFAVGARGGTVGIGPEVAVRLGPVGLRGGYGLLPLELDATDFYKIDRVSSAKLKLPRDWYTVGADFYMGGFFRLGGGLLYKPGDVSADVALDPGARIELGGHTYEPGEVGSVAGVHKSRETAPFALVGFGASAPGGFGVSLDLGVAFLGDAEVDLQATGAASVIDTDEFRRRLEQEEENIADRAATYLKYWPIASVTVRFGFGG